MTLRTVQLAGMGFGASPAEISVSLNGNVVFSGAVTTQNTVPWNLPDPDKKNDTVLLCSFTIPMDLVGTVPMSCTVNNGTVIFGQINANYVPVDNPVFSPAELVTLDSESAPAAKFTIINAHATPAFSAEDLTVLRSTDPAMMIQRETVLKAHGVSRFVSGGDSVYNSVSGATDSRNNVQINGVPTTPDHGDLAGTWWWTVSSGSTLSYDLDVAAGLE